MRIILLTLDAATTEDQNLVLENVRGLVLRNIDVD